MPDEQLDKLIRGSGGGGCFPKGTKVWTPSGPIPIEKLKPGSQVLSYSSSGQIEEDIVDSISTHRDQIIWEIHYWDGSVKVTPNHLFYIDDLNAFKYAGHLKVDDMLLDKFKLIRPVESFTYPQEKATVHNLRVRKNHTYLVGDYGIVVHNGGGGKSGGSPSEQGNAALSRSTIKIVELISEGPIQGFVGLGDPRNNIFLDDTPVRNDDGSLNFSNYVYGWRPGTPNQTYMRGYADEIGSETSVGNDVTEPFPVTRKIVNNQIDAIRVRLGYQLQEFQDDGDITGASVTVAIKIKEGNGAFITRFSNTFNARFETLTEYDYYFTVDNQGGNVDEFTVRVEANAPLDADSKIQKVVRWQSYTEVIEQKLSYPWSSVVGQQFAAEQFSSVPSRSYFIGGILCRIPSNAVVNPNGSLTFSGTWDMTLYTPGEATADPIWQLVELLSNPRFGLGNRITASDTSLADIYQISVHNNEVIPDGFGGAERRYQCNTVMQSTEDAHDQIQLLLNSCNAHYYWGGDRLYFWQDRPGDSIAQVTNADVVNGQFKYSSTDIRSRYSICNVVWNDPDDKFRRAVEPVSVPEAIERYGRREIDFTAPGCTSRGRAVRAGLRRIYTDLYETETVSFTMRLFGIKFRPGHIIDIYDWKKPNQQYAGIVLSGTTSQVNLDIPIILPAGSTYNLKLNLVINGEIVLESRAIADSPGTYSTLNVTTPFSSAPIPGATWSVDVIAPKQFRVRGMQADSDNPAIVEIVAGEYYDQKQNLIENGVALQQLESPISIPTVVPTVAAVSMVEVTINNQLSLDVTWPEPTDENGNRDLFVGSYQFQYKRGINGVWSSTQTITSNSTRIENIVDGVYYARVATVYISGATSNWKESAGYILTDANLYANFRRPKSAVFAF